MDYSICIPGIHKIWPQVRASRAENGVMISADGQSRFVDLSQCKSSLDFGKALDAEIRDLLGEPRPSTSSR